MIGRRIDHYRWLGRDQCTLCFCVIHDIEFFPRESAYFMVGVVSGEVASELAVRSKYDDPHIDSER
jgi:hypothetical protein